MSDEFVPIDIDEVRHVTDRAVLLVILGEEHWIPLSCLGEGEEDELEHGPSEVLVAEWFAEREGLI